MIEDYSFLGFLLVQLMAFDLQSLDLALLLLVVIVVLVSAAFGLYKTFMIMPSPLVFVICGIGYPLAAWVAIMAVMFSPVEDWRENTTPASDEILSEWSAYMKDETTKEVLQNELRSRGITDLNQVSVPGFKDITEAVEASISAQNSDTDADYDAVVNGLSLDPDGDSNP